MSAEPVDLFLAEEEVQERLDRMTDADCWKLAKVADILADGTGWSGEDLVQEAFLAATERRSWRADLTLEVFFTGVIRSLIHARRKAQKRNALDRGLKGDEEKRTLKLAKVPNANPDDPQQLMDEEQDAQAFLDRLKRAFEGDESVLRVIEGRANGETAAQIREALGVDASQYETICRRLTRYRNQTKRIKP